MFLLAPSGFLNLFPLIFIRPSGIVQFPRFDSMENWLSVSDTTRNFFFFNCLGIYFNPLVRKNWNSPMWYINENILENSLWAVFDSQPPIVRWYHWKCLLFNCLGIYFNLLVPKKWNSPMRCVTENELENLVWGFFDCQPLIVRRGKKRVG